MIEWAIFGLEYSLKEIRLPAQRSAGKAPQADGNLGGILRMP
jgi:hypothetical protein